MDLSMSYNANLMHNIDKIIIHVPQLVYDLKIGARLNDTFHTFKYETAGWQFQVPRQDITFVKDNFFGPQPILEKDFILSLNLSDIISKGYLYLEYQGCFENSFCYNKEEKKISY